MKLTEKLKGKSAVFFNEGKEPTKLASSGTEKGIIKLITEFYFGTKVTLVPQGDKWEVHNSKGKIDGVEVVKNGKQFLFQTEASK